MGICKRIGWTACISAFLAAGGQMASAASAISVPPSPVQVTVRSAGSGAWSAASTWEGGHVPTSGARVLIRGGDRVVYDVDSDKPLRSVHVAGTLSFATDRDTRMDVGLLLVRAGEDEVDESAIVDAPHVHDANAPRPVLEVGSADAPVDPTHHALIRLTYFDGMDKDSMPAIVDCGGRMDFHGAAMNRTWVKLGAPAEPGDAKITLNEPVTGWRAGDQIVIPTTLKLSLFKKGGGGIINTVRDDTQTEDRAIKAIDGQTITLDTPLKFEHVAEGEFRGEVANLSRNVIVESADPAGVRGHTMYHFGSQGSISYAEFRHLGKDGVLGRYSLHFHRCGDSMRGSSVVGASIWDSANHWITVHGTDYLVVRDCVGYRAAGHGYFLEDGTEEYNIFDRNLAIEAMHHSPLPRQILPYDDNDGAGFWWANSLNTFTRNVAAECDQYGFRFEAAKTADFDPVLNVRQPDGSKADVDIRTLPFVRFEDNEAHSQRRYGLNLGGFRLVAGTDAYLKNADGKRTINRATTYVGDVGGVGPDNHHPFVIKNFRVWASQWSFHSAAPSVLIDGMDVYDSNYGIWRTRVDRHEYHNISMKKIAEFDVFNPWGGSADFPNDSVKNIKRVDDLPPQTVITHVARTAAGEIVVDGVSSDNGEIVQVVVNGRHARQTAPNFSQWQAILPPAEAKALHITAAATDAAGNVELTPHVVAAPAMR